jgi:hypothetical protein
MASKDITVVEVPKDDNGYDGLSKLFQGATEVVDVEDMVDYVLDQLAPGDCIRTLTIIGHGCPGNISVGNGMSGTGSNKEISLDNEAVWGPQIDRLACKFCDDDDVFLRGCNVGADQAGAQLLLRIARRLRCATVRAPAGLCNGLISTGKIQEAGVGQEEPSTPIPASDYIEDIRRFFRGLFSSVRKKKKKLAAGTGAKTVRDYRAEDIARARYLPRVVGQEFAPALLDSRGVMVPSELVSAFLRALASPKMGTLPAFGFAIEGYLQFEVRGARSPRWLPPGAMLAGSTLYSVLRQDTSIVYLLPESFADPFRTWAQSVRQSRLRKKR